MEMSLSLSAYGGVSTREALTVFWSAGIRYVELAIGPVPDADAVQAIQDFRQQGMVYRAHHAFVWGLRHHPFNLAQPQDWNYFQRLTDWLASLGITAYSVHGGNFRTGSDCPKGKLSPKGTRCANANAQLVAYAKFLENIYRLHQLCQARGIIFGVETMYPTLPSSGKEYKVLPLCNVVKLMQDVEYIRYDIE